MFEIPTAHWSFWIIISLASLFILWLFFGGKKQEYIGLEPLIPIHEVMDLPLEEPVCHEPEIEEIEEKADICIEKVKPTKWKRQELCCKILEEVTGKSFRREVRDLKWLTNPETKRRLEIDCYNDELKIGLEHNGSHHYNYPNTFNKTKQEWINMVRRDKLKIDLCDRNGVYLITIPYTVPEDEIRDEINKQLQPYLDF